jgi:hypothetical protein
MFANKELLTKMMRTASKLLNNNYKPNWFYQNDENQKVLIIANKELAGYRTERQNQHLIIANKELAYQNDEKENLQQFNATTRTCYQMMRRKIVRTLIIANKELVTKIRERIVRRKSKANTELPWLFQIKKKENAIELLIATKNLYFKRRKARRTSFAANKELAEFEERKREFNYC